MCSREPPSTTATLHGPSRLGHNAGSTWSSDLPCSWKGVFRQRQKEKHFSCQMAFPLFSFKAIRNSKLMYGEKVHPSFTCNGSAIFSLFSGFYSLLSWFSLWLCWVLNSSTKATATASPKGPPQFIIKPGIRMSSTSQQRHCMAMLRCFQHSFEDFSHTTHSPVPPLSVACLWIYYTTNGRGIKSSSQGGYLSTQRLFCHRQGSKHAKSTCAVKVVNLPWPGTSQMHWLQWGKNISTCVSFLQQATLHRVRRVGRQETILEMRPAHLSYLFQPYNSLAQEEI